MDETALTQRLGEGLLDRGDQACRAVADDQQRGGQAAVLEISQEVVPGVGRHASHPALRGLSSVRHAVLNHAHGPIAIVPSS